MPPPYSGFPRSPPNGATQYWGQGPGGSGKCVGADPEPAPPKEQCGLPNAECGMAGAMPPQSGPPKEQCGMRNGQMRSGRTRLQQIRMPSVIYITCRAVAQDANGMEAYESTTVRRYGAGGRKDGETWGHGDSGKRGAQCGMRIAECGMNKQDRQTEGDRETRGNGAPSIERREPPSSGGAGVQGGMGAGGSR